MVQSKFEKFLEGMKKLVIAYPSAQLFIQGNRFCIKPPSAEGVHLPMVNFLRPLGFKFDETLAAFTFEVDGQEIKTP